MSKTPKVPKEFSKAVKEAVREYEQLQNRSIHPSGTFDKQGRFYLGKKCACCKGIREPSAAYPFSELVHARTLKHVACANGVDIKECHQYMKTL